eukprot:GGOE01046837.1.p1 GENE.GGOE01046837.1~~GGOE01046837.1.p1  ORF type:complete len:221 (+),score=58.91 GGOE01046837.1:61-723(+)
MSLPKARPVKVSLGDFLGAQPTGGVLLGQRDSALSGGAAGIYTVAGTKKGGIPLSVETRAKGKKVTVLRNIEGDLTALLRDLKDQLGAGGVVHDNGTELEVQGEHEKRIEAFLRSKGCLRGVKGTSVQEPKPKANPQPAPSLPTPSCPMVTPASKDQKKYLERLQRHMDADFTQRHQLVGMSGNAMAKMKYSDFSAIWNDFAAHSEPVQQQAVLTGKVPA